METNDGGPEPRSYGDMVMNEYLKGLAEIAKEHPSKIEKLEALELAATAGIWCADADAVVVGEDYTISENSRAADSYLIASARNALPSLLAVAKAAKGLRATDSKGDWCPMTEQAMEDRERFTAELDAALAQLEATP